MSEIIERVARAIHWEAGTRGVDAECRSWESDEESVRDTYRIIAQAAIEAMREPTEEMTEAGKEECLRRQENSSSSELVGVVFGAMISAALKE